MKLPQTSIIFARNISHPLSEFSHNAFAKICPLLLPEFPIAFAQISGKANGEFGQKQWENLGKSNEKTRKAAAYISGKKTTIIFARIPIAFSRISHCFFPNVPLLLPEFPTAFAQIFRFQFFFLGGGTVPPAAPPPPASYAYGGGGVTAGDASTSTTQDLRIASFFSFFLLIGFLEQKGRTSITYTSPPPPPRYHLRSEGGVEERSRHGQRRVASSGRAHCMIWGISTVHSRWLL